MKVKTYKTQSLQEGLEDIKRDLGGEALILSTRSVPVRAPFNLFRKPTWEITAALEEKTVTQPAPSPGVSTRSLPTGEIPLVGTGLREAAINGARARQGEAL